MLSKRRHLHKWALLTMHSECFKHKHVLYNGEIGHKGLYNSLIRCLFHRTRANIQKPHLIHFPFSLSLITPDLSKTQVHKFSMCFCAQE
jgi:hypothetical protein